MCDSSAKGEFLGAAGTGMAVNYIAGNAHLIRRYLAAGMELRKSGDNRCMGQIESRRKDSAVAGRLHGKSAFRGHLYRKSDLSGNEGLLWQCAS